MGKSNYFIVTEFHYRPNFQILHQRKYILDLFEKVQMLVCSTSPTPLVGFPSITGPPMKNAALYIGTIGALQHVLYLSRDKFLCQRAESILAQFIGERLTFY